MFSLEMLSKVVTGEVVTGDVVITTATLVVLASAKRGGLL